jgi:hypothetical protein
MKDLPEGFMDRDYCAENRFCRVEKEKVWAGWSVDSLELEATARGFWLPW